VERLEEPLGEPAERTEPRWLDDEERDTWLAFAGVLVLLGPALDAQLQRDAGLSHFEYQVLAMLSEAPQRTVRMGDLAALANGSLSRLSHVVTRLEKRGWVTRGPDPTNRRVTLATLTDDGWAKVVDTAPGHVEEVRRLVFDPLTKTQQRHLRDASRRIQRALHPNGDCRPPGS
jgi:DNA-binding MarR family transcriptional regulator